MLHVAQPYKPFMVSKEVKEKVEWFMDVLWEHTVNGSGLIDGCETPNESVLRELLPGLLDENEITWFQNTAKQFVKMIDDQMIGSPDLLIMVMKIWAKVFSRTDKFVGLWVFTGPAGGGKSSIISAMCQFGGEGITNVCKSLGNSYLHDMRIRGAEECKP
eukprot:12409137-Karenia_brevis.AAC.1